MSRYTTKYLNEQEWQNELQKSLAPVCAWLFLSILIRIKLICYISMHKQNDWSLNPQQFIIPNFGDIIYEGLLIGTSMIILKIIIPWWNFTLPYLSMQQQDEILLEEKGSNL